MHVIFLHLDNVVEFQSFGLRGVGKCQWLNFAFYRSFLPILVGHFVKS